MPTSPSFSWDHVDPDLCARIARAATRRTEATPGLSLVADGFDEPTDHLLRGYDGSYAVLDVLLHEWLPRDLRALRGVYVAADEEGEFGNARTAKTLPSPETMLKRLSRLRWRHRPSIRRLLVAELLRAGTPGTSPEDLDVGALNARTVVDTRTGSPPRLFPHQESAVASLARRFRRDGFSTRGLLVMPTGSGKTVTAVSWLVDDVVGQGHKVLWVTHREELVRQTATAFVSVAPRLAVHGIDRLELRLVGGGFGGGSLIGDSGHDVLVATVQTLARRQAELESWLTRHNVVVVFDEAHHSPAPSWRRIVRLATETTNDAVIGLTATPTRTRRTEIAELAALFGGTRAEPADAIIHEVAMGDLLRAGILARPTVVPVATNIDITSDLTPEDERLLLTLNTLPPRLRRRLVESDVRNTTIVDTWVDGRQTYGRTILFAIDTDHCEELVRLFQARGVACATVHYNRHRDENRQALRAFRDGDIDVLVNIDMLTEGVDAPETQSVFLTRPTGSLALFSQMVGRALRGSKVGGTADAYVVDFQDLWSRFPEWRASWAEIDIPPEDETATPPMEPAPSEEPLLGEEEAAEPDAALIAQIAQTLDRVRRVTTESGIAAVPVGYYAYQQDAQDGTADRTLLVFAHQETGFDRLREAVDAARLGELRASTDWLADFFDDLPAPTPPAAALADLRSWVLDAGSFPLFRRFATLDAIDPASLARRCHTDGITDIAALEARATAVFQEHPALAAAIWGDRYEYVRLVTAELVDRRMGLPAPLEQIQLPFIAGGRLEDWTYGGGHFDLETVMRRLIADTALFATPLPEPARIRWARPGARHWGFYRRETGEIVVNPLLDSADTPAFVLDFLVYHELLHHEQEVEEHELGPRNHLAHGPRFRAREQEHPHWQEANRFLDTFEERYISRPAGRTRR